MSQEQRFSLLIRPVFEYKVSNFYLNLIRIVTSHVYFLGKKW